eukprot:40068-Eustigmatos_ZCMA.PRE.1
MACRAKLFAKAYLPRWGWLPANRLPTGPLVVSLWVPSAIKSVDPESRIRMPQSADPICQSIRRKRCDG